MGTGINAHPEFGGAFCAELQRLTGIAFEPSRNYFEALSAQDAAVELSGQLKVIAVSLMKIANDLRWMNSGPLAGLGEIALPALQPGSSIMPGKVNPVIPEATTMVAAQVIGNDATITIAGQSGNFQLNVMLPRDRLQPAREHPPARQRGACCWPIARSRASPSIAPALAEALERNPILVTALNPVIGYEKGAAIAKHAYAEGQADPRGGRCDDRPDARAARPAARSDRAHPRWHQGWQQRRGLSSARMAAPAPTVAHELPADWRARLRRRLLPAPDHRAEHCRPAGVARGSALVRARLRESWPGSLQTAAVLVPIMLAPRHRRCC